MKGFLDEVNRKNELQTEITLRYSPIGFAIYLAVVGILNVVYCLLKYGYVSTDHLYYPAKYVYVSKFNIKLYNFFYKNEYVVILRLPWNQETVFGWIGMLIFVMFGSATYVFLNVMFMMLFASICSFHKAFYKNSKHLLSQLDEVTNVEPIELRDLNKITPLLCEIMKNGIKGKE